MSQEPKYLTLTESTFDSEIREAPQPVMVDFWAAWCGPCLAIAPVIDRLATRYQGKAKVAKVNVDDNPNLAVRYGVLSIPTVLFFRDGEVVDRVVGAVPGTVLEEKLEAVARAA